MITLAFTLLYTGLGVVVLSMLGLLALVLLVGALRSSESRTRRWRWVPQSLARLSIQNRVKRVFFGVMVAGLVVTVASLALGFSVNAAR